MKAVDKMFLDRAKNALRETGCTALEFLRANPVVPLTELAKRLNRGASALGLVMAIYQQATDTGCVREAAKDLLTRRVIDSFPDGWTSQSDVHPLIRIGFWDKEIADYTLDAQYGVYAKKIIRELTIDHPPPEGWKAQPENDPRIDQLFNRFWPKA